MTVFPVDYNSWIESDAGRKLADTLDKDVILAEGGCCLQFHRWTSDSG